MSGDADVAKLVHSMIEYTVLGDVTKLTEIYYDPDPVNTIVTKDREFVKDYYEMGEETEDFLQRLSPWVLRIELNQVVMVDKKIKMNEIAAEIAKPARDAALLEPALLVRLLTQIEDTEFFATIRFLVIAAMFSVPEYGGQ